MKITNYPKGATPLNDTSSLKLDWVKDLPDLNRAESENIIKAQRRYLNRRITNPSQWFNPRTLNIIHKHMYGDVWEWAGMYRTFDTNIGVPYHLISPRIADLCHEVNFWINNPAELTFLEQAARIHHKLVFIHPFENGNGRFSRLIADRYLRYWNCPYPAWPIDLQEDGLARDEYLESLQQADQGNYIPLITFMKKCGAQNPPLNQLIGNRFYTNKLHNEQIIALVKASLRIDADITENKNLALHIAIKQRYDDIALLLIQHKINITWRDRSGLDSFEVAIISSNYNIAHALVAAGYPYKRGCPPPSKLLNYYSNLYNFEMQL